MFRNTRRRTPWAAVAALGATSFVALAGIQPALAASPATSQASTASTAGASFYAAPAAAAAEPVGEYTQRFLTMYNKIHDPANGYFSPQGIPYHSVETLIVEAPDYGHETTSEAYSFWLWLEASYGEATGDWAPYNKAWTTIEQYMIPTSADQPTAASYNPNSPATYAAEHATPNLYPSVLDQGVRVGVDPIAAELKSTYGTSDVYAMHWLADVDNKYGFGVTPGAGCQLGPSAAGTSYINTFQRGTQESVWETVPQPSCDDFTFGGTNGYLDLFTKDASYSKQWKYTAAPDADARAVESAYWANQWASAQGKGNQVATSVSKASKMGDYLRYSLFDKYFKVAGCASTSCAAGTGKNSANYLLSWYFAWGGSNDTSNSWAWRIGSSHSHFGYQNPMAAYALANDPALEPASATATSDWSTSMQRQLEFYSWLQSAEGGIAGGATNSWNGAYGTPPAGTATFYGMGYTEAPVYSDPSSNQWFGMQVWGMERVAQLYNQTGNAQAKAILDKWVPWAIANTQATGESWSVPSTLIWTGQPNTWNAANPVANSGLHVSVQDSGQDVGVAGGLARTLMYYAAKSGSTSAQSTAKNLLDSIWTYDQDDLGVSTTEVRTDYARFDDVQTTAAGNGLYVPAGWKGTMPNGDVISSGKSFLDIRSWYTQDEDWPKVQAYLDGGAAPEFNYHRFWAQTAVATALADYDRLFGETTPVTDTVAPSVPANLAAGTTTTSTVPLTWTASTDNVAVTGYDVYQGTTKIGSSTTTSYTVTGLAANTSYTFTVRAKDGAGNISAASAPVTATTKAAPDTIAPSVPTNLTAGTTTTSTVPLTWTASTDNVAVTGYDVYQGTTLIGSTTTTSYTATALAANTSFTFTVRAQDAAGNTSAASAPATATTKTTVVIDTIAPTTPTNLTAGTTTTSTIPLTWTASTDNVAVTGYDIYQGSTKIGSTTTTSYTVTGLAADTSYTFTVRAKDAAGNTSAASAPTTATTKANPVNPTSTCQVTYTTYDWNTGFTANLKIKNTGTTPITGWSLGFAFPAGQTVSTGWSALYTATGATQTVTNQSWNGTINPGQSVEIGFNGTHTGTNPRPTTFTLNSTTCTT